MLLDDGPGHERGVARHVLVRVRARVRVRVRIRLSARRSASRPGYVAISKYSHRECSEAIAKVGMVSIAIVSSHSK